MKFEYFLLTSGKQDNQRTWLKISLKNTFFATSLTLVSKMLDSSLAFLTFLSISSNSDRQLMSFRFRSSWDISCKAWRTSSRLLIKLFVSRLSSLFFSASNFMRMLKASLFSRCNLWMSSFRESTSAWSATESWESSSYVEQIHFNKNDLQSVRNLLLNVGPVIFILCVELSWCSDRNGA